jgi:hypothetical protein
MNRNSSNSSNSSKSSKKSINSKNSIVSKNKYNKSKKSNNNSKKSNITKNIIIKNVTERIGDHSFMVNFVLLNLQRYENIKGYGTFKVPTSV